MATDSDPQFEELLAFLKEERGFDFTGYKRASLLRRVQHRMAEVGIDGFEAYHDYLQVHPEEFTGLFNTILINVTSFFRDPEAWEYLAESVLPGLLSRRQGEPIRAWCAGCASGEEAYTLAVVLAEALGIDEFKARVKIYATDVDEEALATARQATYTERDVSSVPDELRDKYFERNSTRFTFRKELRRSVIFGRNDLVQDAPISHVDILTCRNTLMYFNADAQADILRRLHFALRPDGALFLGKAEMLLTHSALFRPLEIGRRFFVRLPAEARERRLATVRASIGGAVAEAPEDHARLRRAALTAVPTAQVVLDREGRVAVTTTRAAYLFGLSVRDLGRPFQDLELSYRPAELRAPIAAAVDERRQVWVRDVTWVRGTADPMSFDIQVMPLTDEAGALLGTSIVFNDVTHSRRLQQELEFANRQLETAYEELQSTNEELETTNEELQSTVEELETTNEELETMNEELQSMNEELHLSNESQREHQERVHRLNRFLSSVLGSMNAGVAAVDDDLRVIGWNAKAEDLWGVRADEAEGQYLFNLDIGLPLAPLRPALERQLSGDEVPLEVVEVEAMNRRGRNIRVRVTATRLAEDGEPPSGALLVMDVVEPASA